jgi:hypothetical protein
MNIKDWYDAYCDAHPEFDGYNDAAIDAFWNAATAAGYTADDVNSIDDPVTTKAERDA